MATIYPVARKSGRAWRVQVRKVDGTSTTRTFPTQREAKQWANHTEQQIATGKRVDATRGQVRFGDVLDAYVSAHGRQMGRSKTAGLKLLRRRLGSVKLTDLALGNTYTDFVSGRRKTGPGRPQYCKTCRTLGLCWMADPSPSVWTWHSNWRCWAASAGFCRTLDGYRNLGNAIAAPRMANWCS